jgi:hypothetical protein
VLALLAVGAGAGWAYVRSQYYVGIDGEQVAIFRGVTGSVGPVRLSSVEERTELEAERLDPIAASRVEQGIVAADREDAESIVERLVQRFPDCAPEAAAPAPVPTPTVLTGVPAFPGASPAPLPSAAATAAPALEACPS